MRDFEEAAKQKRDAEEAARQRKVDAAATLPARQEAARRYRRNDVFATSLGGGTNVTLALLAITLLIPGGGFAALAWRLSLTNWLEYATTIAGCVIGLAGALVVPDFFQGLIARARLARFARSVPGLDAAAYREAMSENRGQSTLILRVEFAGAWTAKKDDVADAVTIWAPLKSAEWAGEDLVLTSEPIKTRELIIGRGSSSTIFTNRNLHLCFARIASQVLPRLAAVTPIRQVRWSIDGAIEPWNASTTRA